MTVTEQRPGRARSSTTRRTAPARGSSLPPRSSGPPFSGSTAHPNRARAAAATRRQRQGSHPPYGWLVPVTSRRLAIQSTHRRPPTRPAGASTGAATAQPPPARPRHLHSPGSAGSHRVTRPGGGCIVSSGPLTSTTRAASRRGSEIGAPVHVQDVCTTAPEYSPANTCTGHPRRTAPPGCPLVVPTTSSRQSAQFETRPVRPCTFRGPTPPLWHARRRRHDVRGGVLVSSPSAAPAGRAAATPPAGAAPRRRTTARDLQGQRQVDAAAQHPPQDCSIHRPRRVRALSGERGLTQLAQHPRRLCRVHGGQARHVQSAGSPLRSSPEGASDTFCPSRPGGGFRSDCVSPDCRSGHGGGIDSRTCPDKFGTPLQPWWTVPGC